MHPIVCWVPHALSVRGSRVPAHEGRRVEGDVIIANTSLNNISKFGGIAELANPKGVAPHAHSGDRTCELRIPLPQKSSNRLKRMCTRRMRSLPFIPNLTSYPIPHTQHT